MKTYQQKLAEAAQRAEEIRAHVLTDEELDRLHYEARDVVTGEAEPIGRRSYAVGGYFRAADGAVLSQTRARNVPSYELAFTLKTFAMRDDAVSVEYWPEAF